MKPIGWFCKGMKQLLKKKKKKILVKSSKYVGIDILKFSHLPFVSVVWVQVKYHKGVTG